MAGRAIGRSSFSKRTHLNGSGSTFVSLILKWLGGPGKRPIILAISGFGADEALRGRGFASVKVSFL